MNPGNESFVLVKPDGMARKLIPVIRELLRHSGLKIQCEHLLLITPDMVESLYEEHRGKDHFTQLPQFMSSRPLHVFRVCGHDAIRKVRSVVGKRFPPSGIRSVYAHSIMANIAHSPDASEAFLRESRLLFSKGTTSMIKRVYLIGGMSECGKSTVGKYLEAHHGISRLKIVTYLRQVQATEGNSDEFYAWNDRAEKERPTWLYEQFVKAFLGNTTIERCALESLYSPVFGQFVRQCLPEQAVIVYVDVPQDIRVERQMGRANISSYEEAKVHLIQRDEVKRGWKTDHLKDIADIIIDNSGPIDHLYKQVDDMTNRYL